MIALATTVADHRGHLIPKARAHLPALAARFGTIAVAATTGTPTETLDLLRAQGALVARNESDSRRIGRHRRQALAMAAESGRHVMYLDLDHALRWVEHEPAPSSTRSSPGRCAPTAWSSGARRRDATRCRAASATPRRS